MDDNWSETLALAETEVRGTVDALPDELRVRARKLPVVYERVPSDEMLDDVVQPDTLGLFVGEAFPDGDGGPSPIPPQIFLFLENLWEFAEGDEETFLEEVHITYIHELGHYLGLNEDELDERGLL
ncbi:MAG: metallopeptidase family protein [Proteobacteria bacterium]|nr:metallopeptidase family protein [Pseudomonadota bacterium]NDE99597.1 metallopeptidase family protein [Verrucomicrobiota bacterium]